MKYLNLLVITLFLTGCATSDKSCFEYLENKTAEAAKKLSVDKDYIKSIGSEKIARNSYFYILAKDGHVVYHPEKALTGNDFSRFGFVRRIMAEKNGCLRVTLGNMSRIIIFRETASGEILCLTAAAEGFTGSEKCNIYDHEEAK